MRQLLFISLTLISCTSTMAEPLYWKAQKGKLNYLIIGSVHIGNESMYPLPKTLTDKLVSSDGLIIESDIRETTEVKYPPTRIQSQDVLAPQQKDELKGLANLLNLNTQELLLSPPWATALALQMRQIEYLGYQASDGVDRKLIAQAEQSSLPIIGLESIQFQIDLLTKLEQSGKELLISTIEEFDHSEDTTHCLIKSWKAGDVKKLNEFAELSEMSPELEKALITRRNNDWADKLAQPIWTKKSTGDYILVVGTLHLLGEQSLLQLLAKKGFKVTQLSLSTEANCQFQY
ncbi:TraB/GumN family protein [Vibrio ostreicida]|uniref:TraB/GumN family protein n=1 Tax=Vibrio ostreicida TaxID=526588 RepID=A0ABT8BU89_9VIBR|nr:TraB/GumN family protein [Vibrio ostreicida]MDN3610736.1 TraB/GumN family protein [Vibrio ostreicida]NPD07266.1 TraB/GumN family protein [Vibrio ostreicida]